jgi:hypothetical protein
LRPFTFTFNQGNSKKLQGKTLASGGHDSRVAFAQKFPGEKGSVSMLL